MWWSEAWEPLGDLAEQNPKPPNRRFCANRLLCAVKSVFHLRTKNGTEYRFIFFEEVRYHAHRLTFVQFVYLVNYYLDEMEQ
jgi:hypothetical protein